LLKQHREIYEAILAKDPERATSAAESHLGYVKEMSEKELPGDDLSSAFPLDPKTRGLFKPMLKDNENSTDGEAS
jgi:hypothetical protein